MFEVGIGRVSQFFLHLLFLYFTPLIVPTSSDGGETGLLQTVVAIAVCSVPSCDTFAAGDCMVTAVGGTLQTTLGAASRIVPC